jgi:TPR repeat protein
MALFTAALARARRGEGPAQLQVGRAYLAGKGVPRDVARGLHWLQHAERRGTTDALVVMGQSLEQGLAGRVDGIGARNRYHAAAMRHSAEALMALGNLYLHGAGVIEPDMIESLKWFSLSAAAGSIEGGAAQSALAARLSYRDVEYAVYRAEKWQVERRARMAEIRPGRHPDPQSAVSNLDLYRMIDVYQVANLER